MSYFHLNFRDLNMDFFNWRCFSTKDRLDLCFILCFIIIKFLFFIFSLWVVLANSFILDFLEPNFSLSLRPSRTVAKRASLSCFRFLWIISMFAKSTSSSRPFWFTRGLSSSSFCFLFWDLRKPWTCFRSWAASIRLKSASVRILKWIFYWLECLA